MDREVAFFILKENCMPIVLSRIDDRLIHGQVVEGWMKVIRVTSIIVVSNELARDKMGQAMMSMAVPESVKVESLTIDDTAARYAVDRFEKENVMLLFSNPRDVRILIEKGVKIGSVNIGGMHFSPGKRRVMSTLNVDEEDVRNILSIADKGIELEGRVFPGDEKTNVADILKQMVAA